MAQPNKVCVLVAEVPGTDRLADALDADEASHAIERCMHRMDRAIEANAGKGLRRGPARVCALFERCDAAILAACEMLERVQSLPPLRGLRMAIRVGLHFGEAESGDGEHIATSLAEAAKPGHALASEAVLNELSSGTRQFAGAVPSRNPDLAGLGWPAYPVGRQPAALSSIPVATRISQRLRIRHQQDILFVEETRPILLFGRELGNDVVIPDPRASRQHARIERRHEGFVLIDQSTNGTFLAEDGSTERCIKAGEVPLAGAGRIGCGFSANEIERDLVFFEVL